MYVCRHLYRETADTGNSIVSGYEARLIDNAGNQARVQADASLYIIAHTGS